MTKELSTKKEEVKIKKFEFDPVGYSMYGPSFIKYQKIEEYRDLIQPFKEYYYARKKENVNATLSGIVKDFNETLVDKLPNGLTDRRKFHPYTSQLRTWRKKWDTDILDQMGLIIPADATKSHINKVIKTRQEEDSNKYYIPDYKSLEGAVQTLGGELINDAFVQMEEDRKNSEDFSPEELMKRKKHILDVFSGVSKMVQGKANLLLKESQEKREEAGFIMDFMRAAASGSLKPEDIEDLKKVYTNTNPKVTEAYVK